MEAFEHNKVLNVGYFMCIENLIQDEQQSRKDDALPPTSTKQKSQPTLKEQKYLNLIEVLITNVRNFFGKCSEKVFTTTWNLQISQNLKSAYGNDYKCYKEMLDKLHALDVSLQYCENSEDYLEKLMLKFCKQNPNSYVALIACTAEFYKRILKHEELQNHLIYFFYNLELNVEDSKFLENATDAIHVNYFVDLSLTTRLPAKDQLPIKAPRPNTKLFLILDLENIPYPDLHPRLIRLILNNFIDFDVTSYAAMTQKRFGHLKEHHKELHEIPDLELRHVGLEKNAADYCLTLLADQASRDHPKAYFGVVTSDSDFSKLIVRLRYRSNHNVRLFHNITEKKMLRVTV